MARILAVEGIEQQLQVIRSGLRPPEFEVVTARTGAQALEHASRGDFDLIVLDADLPDLDGVEVCRRLRLEDHTRSVPVLFLSARAVELEARIGVLDLGVVDAISAPLRDPELVRARIRALLRLRRDYRRQQHRCHELTQRLLFAEQSVAAERETVDDLETLLQIERDEARPVGLFDGGMHLVEASDAFRLLLARSGDDALASLARRLRSEASRGAVRFELRLGSVVLEVECGWIRPGALLCVRLADTARAQGVRRRIDDRRPAERARVRDDGAESQGYRVPGFVGRSETLKPLFAAIGQLRHQRVTVLVQGETGTGKELIARALHFGGRDAHRPFIPIHCGAVSPELIESELFGHVKGAFTGAIDSKQGLFAAADGGTVFLDEIAETSVDLQIKLLRVLQHGEIRPVGATHPRHVDVRIVAATNQDLRALVRSGAFREDLYYRLEVVTLDVPPLRDRLGDVPELVDHFVARFNDAHRGPLRRVDGVARPALDRLCRYPWPGNVRELENVVERAFALSSGATIGEEHLPEKVRTGRPALEGSAPSAARAPLDLKAAAEDSQRRLIRSALEENGWDMARTAAVLNLPRSTFYRKCSRLGIRRERGRGRRPAQDA